MRNGTIAILYCSIPLVLAAIGQDASSGEAQSPRVDVRLVTPKVFVGEAAVLELRVVAARDVPALIIRPDRVFRHGAIAVTLLDPGGNTVPGGLPEIVPPIAPEPSDLMRIRGGNQFTARIDVPYRAIVSGTHRLQVSVQLTGREGAIARHEFDLEVLPLDDDTVRERVLLQLPNVRDQVSIVRGRIDEHDLLVYCRRTGTAMWVQRVAIIPPEARLSAVWTSGVDEARGWGEICIQWQEGNAEHLRVIGLWYAEPRWPPALSNDRQ